MAERQFGPYRLVRQIAVGGMAEIHLAKTKGIAGFEKYVALKMIHPNYAADEQFIGMLVDEAKIAVQLTHGNIAQTFDLGRVGETYYITMEYVDGADLYKILRRGSETDVEMPLDVCAFVAKEIASALDHAHRKRDHSGKTLGIVHRDVSPQNVLLSYSGEVKLVDFGIAKATMKAKHTAVGVIKGKYYYMSPEQAWGDQIDYRSDIFSAGIVLYEMITGQMLYLEEDLQRLLEMVRNADIAPPSTLRRGVPPQLERIVMHALAKDRRDRYQSASDFATDLERFLHSFSPVFTASKVANLMKQIIGEPASVPEATADVEHRDGPTSTHTLSSEDLIQDKEELERDENSVIFRVADLRPKKQSDPPKDQPPQRAKQPTGGLPAGPRVTRQADINDIAPPKQAPLPSMPKPAAKPAKAQPQSKPRDANEVTREVQPIAGRGTDDSGLLGLDGPGPKSSSAVAWKKHDAQGTMPGDEPGTDPGAGEHTMISAAPSAFGGFMMDDAAEDSVDATQISSVPPADDTNPNVDPFDAGGTFSGETHDVETAEDNEALDGDDGPTIQRDWRENNKKPKVSAKSAPPPALAAKIHAPAVSELRKPRASRKTPGAGLPAQANLLQQIVSSKPSEPMPAPRPGSAPEGSAQRNDDSGALTLPDRPAPAIVQAPPRSPMQQSTILGQTSPLAHRTGQVPIQPARISASTPAQPAPQVPSTHGSQGYPVQSGLPPPPGQSPSAYAQGYPQQYPGYPQGGYPGYSGQPPAPVSPGALYQLQPYGAPPPQPMTMTSQLRLWEADELGDKYKLSKGAPRWLVMVIASVIAVSLAAGVTFFIIKATRDSAPGSANVRVESEPAGAEVVFDGVRIAGTTPLTVDGVPTATRHEVRVELPRHKPYTETIDIPKKGGEVPVHATLEPMLGKLRVVTHPDGAQIRIDGQLKGTAPRTIEGLDMATTRKLELRLEGYENATIDLDWSDKGYIDIDTKLVKD